MYGNMNLKVTAVSSYTEISTVWTLLASRTKNESTSFRSMKKGLRPQARNKLEDSNQSCPQNTLFLFLAVVDGQRVGSDDFKRDAPLSKILLKSTHVAHEVTRSLAVEGAIWTSRVALVYCWPTMFVSTHSVCVSFTLNQVYFP